MSYTSSLKEEVKLWIKFFRHQLEIDELKIMVIQLSKGFKEYRVKSELDSI